MTGTEIKDFVKHMLFEDAATTGLANDAQFGSTIAIANQAVWVAAAQISPSLFSVQRSLSVPEGGTDFTGIDASGVYSISAVHLSVGQGRYVALSPVLGPDRAQYFGTSRPLGYSLEGEHLYLTPDVAADIRVSYIPVLQPLLPTTQALNGKLPLFHPLVAYEAAIMLATKDEANTSGFVRLRDEMMASLKSHLVRRQTQFSRSIRSIPYA